MPILAVMLTVTPISASAIPAINCHCFRDRSFDPARPTAADAYFLATAQNSFFAAVFNVDKKTVVMKKQGGTSSDDMWVGYWVATRYGQSADNLLQAKRSKELWRDVLPSAGLSAKSFEDRFSQELNAGASSSRLALAIVDGLLESYGIIAPAELAGMRKSGATSQEMILSALIAARTGKSPLQIRLEANNASKSWGKMLSEARIATPQIQGEVTALLKRR